MNFFLSRFSSYINLYGSIKDCFTHSLIYSRDIFGLYLHASPSMLLVESTLERSDLTGLTI